MGGGIPPSTPENLSTGEAVNLNYHKMKKLTNLTNRSDENRRNTKPVV